MVKGLVNNIDLGTIGIIGTTDLNKAAFKNGPIAHTYGVVKGPAPLVYKHISNDEVQIINSKKCLMFLCTAEIAWVEECAKEVKENLTTFQVNGSDKMPMSLTNYLFGTKMNDTVIITDMSIPKGYQ
jgi:hypothetical protein